MTHFVIKGKTYGTSTLESAAAPCTGCAGEFNKGVSCMELPACGGFIFKEVTPSHTFTPLPATAHGASARCAYDEGFSAGRASKQAEWDAWLQARSSSDEIAERTDHAERLAGYRSTDPASSKSAARVVGRKAGKIADLILIELRCANKTGKQLAASTGVPLNSITPRFASLQRRGLIHAADGTGREIVWALGNGVAGRFIDAA